MMLEISLVEQGIQFQHAAADSGEVIFLTDTHGIFTFVNRAFEELYGYVSAEILGKQTPRILKSGRMAEEDYALFWQAISEGQVVQGEFTNQTKTGEYVDVEGSVNPIRNEANQIIGYLAIQRNVTERKAAVENLRQRNKELSALNSIANLILEVGNPQLGLQRALDTIISLDFLGGDVRGALFLKDPSENKLNMVVHRGFPEGHPCLESTLSDWGCLCGTVAKTGVSIVSADNRKDPHHKPLADVSPHRDVCFPISGSQAVLGVINLWLPIRCEIIESDVKLLEMIGSQIGMALENDFLRNARKETIIKERGRIARELHDGIAQLLVYFNTKASAARYLIKRGDEEKAVEQLLQLEDATQALSLEIREVILGLRMTGEVENGFFHAIWAFSDRFSELSKLPIELAVSDECADLKLPIDAELELLRIAQEALVNVRKHAKASSCHIRVFVEGSHLKLQVEDDGQGFEYDPTGHGGDWNYGIDTMRERAEAIGADFDLRTSPGDGTRITVALEGRYA
jgi:PAS domain S-box-containing protein